MEEVGSVAQRLEQGTHNPLGLGSNPSGPTVFGGARKGAVGRKTIHRLWKGGGNRQVFFEATGNRGEHDLGGEIADSSDGIEPGGVG